MSAKVQHLEAHAESEATQTQRYEINVSDLEAVIEMAGLCRDARPGLDWVWVEAGDGELRIVATDAKVMGVARLYDTSTTPPARAVEGLTNWTPTPSGGVSYREWKDRLGGFLKGRTRNHALIVEVGSSQIEISDGPESIQMRLGGWNAPNYLQVFEDVITNLGTKPQAPVILEGDQWAKLIRSTGARTAGDRRGLFLKVTAKMGGKNPEPMLVEVVGEQRWSHRRWVGLLAPTVEPEEAREEDGAQ